MNTRKRHANRLKLFVSFSFYRPRIVLAGYLVDNDLFTSPWTDIVTLHDDVLDGFVVQTKSSIFVSDGSKINFRKSNTKCDDLRR